jgi:hypothetical protein
MLASMGWESTLMAQALFFNANQGACIKDTRPKLPVICAEPDNPAGHSLESIDGRLARRQNGNSLLKGEGEIYVVALQHF